MKIMELKIKLRVVLAFVVITSSLIIASQLSAQQVDVDGKLKVTQMTADDTQNNLVIHNPDGTLGTRSVASLPPPPPPIDTSRNLASDFELAKHLCNCPNLPPFFIKKLLESGYSEQELFRAGVPFDEIENAQFTCGDTIIDKRDGKPYTTLFIKGQCWMAQNLNIGTMINSATGGTNGDGIQTDNGTIEKYCYDDDPANCTTYGGFYQWDEMMQYETIEGTQGICPTGWHLPTDNEWKTLEKQLGMTQAQADAIGYRGTDQGSQLAGNEPLWTDGDLDQNGAFGSSGFTGLPAGAGNPSGFGSQSTRTYFWSSSEGVMDETVWYRQLDYDSPEVVRGGDSFKSNGASVRCVKD